MTAQLSRQRAAALPGLGLLAAGLALASLVELLILRTFTRTAVHIPGLEALQEPYEALALTGRYAYFVSLTLLLLALPVLAWRLWLSQGAAGRIGAAAVAFFAAGAAFAAFESTERLVVDAMTTTAVVTLAMSAGWMLARGAVVPVLLFAAAFALSAGHTITQGMAQAGLGTTSADGLLRAGELAGVAFAVSTPWLVGRVPSRGAVVAGVAVAVLTLGFFLGNGSTSRILLLWNEGLSGTLPSVFYAAAAGALAMTVTETLRTRDVAVTVGLLLLTTGGIGLHNTYQTGLVTTGLAVLAVAAGESSRFAPAENPADTTLGQRTQGTG